MITRAMLTKPRSSGATHVLLAPAPKIPTSSFTGCLRRDGDQYQLTNVEGSQVEKGRSWKTGFLGKHARTITIVDSGNRLKLGSHVGERVSVTGTLVDKEMQGRSLKRETPSCD